MPNVGHTMKKIARQNGISVDDVAKLAGAKAIAAADKGHIVQDASGKWFVNNPLTPLIRTGSMLVLFLSL